MTCFRRYLRRGQRTYRPVQLGVGSSPSGGHSLLARYPETLTSATQTYFAHQPFDQLLADHAVFAMATTAQRHHLPRINTSRSNKISPNTVGQIDGRNSSLSSWILLLRRGQRTYRPVQLGVGSSPSGGHSLLARYPETLTSATQTYFAHQPFDQLLADHAVFAMATMAQRHHLPRINTSRSNK